MKTTTMRKVFAVWGPSENVPTVYAKRALLYERIERERWGDFATAIITVSATASCVEYYPESFNCPGVPVVLPIHYTGHPNQRV